jgi:LysM repeat protein
MYGATKVGKRAAAVPAIKHEKNSIIHQVQQNDTLLGIAVKYGVSVLEIKVTPTTINRRDMREREEVNH